jgi:hypothetical protein
LYSAHNVSDNFACKYDISSLKSGSYTVVVESNDKSMEQTFVIN